MVKNFYFEFVVVVVFVFVLVRKNIYCEPLVLNSLLGGKETQSGFFESVFEILSSAKIITGCAC